MIEQPFPEKWIAFTYFKFHLRIFAKKERRKSYKFSRERKKKYDFGQEEKTNTLSSNVHSNPQ